MLKPVRDLDNMLLESPIIRHQITMLQHKSELYAKRKHFDLAGEIMKFILCKQCVAISHATCWGLPPIPRNLVSLGAMNTKNSDF